MIETNRADVCAVTVVFEPVAGKLVERADQGGSLLRREVQALVLEKGLDVRDDAGKQLPGSRVEKAVDLISKIGLYFLGGPVEGVFEDRLESRRIDSATVGHLH